MKAKTLLATAALGAGLMASASAQVYSVNAVGYVNMEIPAGYSIIANPLDAGEGMNTIGNLFDAAPNGTVIYDFLDSGTYNIQTKIGAFQDPSVVMAPGRGMFIRNTSGAPFTITFVGEVMQGSLSNALPPGLSIRASQVPQAGPIVSVLGLPAETGDIVYKFDNASGLYTVVTRGPAELGNPGDWLPVGSAEPELAVGEGVFLSMQSGKDWTREFSVND